MLCLTAGALAASLAIPSFTLAWVHSIEKARWEEDWQLDNGMLRITEARIRSAGAGMEPPADARLVDGTWHYRPRLAPQASLRLAHSGHVAGYLLCTFAGCKPLADYLPGLATEAVIELRPCG